MIDEKDIAISNFDPGGQRSLLMFGKKFEHIPTGITVILFNRKQLYLLKPIAMQMIEVGVKRVKEMEERGWKDDDT